MKRTGAMKPTVRLLGTRGVPASHGGFETAAERIGLFLVARGWRVVVYCQDDDVRRVERDTWRGIDRVRMPGRGRGSLGTVWFDLVSTLDAARHRDPVIVFGYNTAFLTVVHRLRRQPVLMNMDGIEWKRARWGRFKRLYLYLNERVGSLAADHLIADHPEIKRHLSQWVSADKATMIPYGADSVTTAARSSVEDLGLEAGGFVTLIARPVEENSILEVVEAFSRRTRGVKLAILGSYDTERVEYHRRVVEAAGSEVVFLGAIYDDQVVQSLRFHSLAYVHGHTVGGTNPSLVEALGCGNAVIAHDNVYNRWVAGRAGLYFNDAATFEAALDSLLAQPDAAARLSAEARARHAEEFTWPTVAGSYETLLAQIGARGRR